MWITLELLRPTALAAIAATLSMEASEADALADDGIGKHGTVDALISMATEAADALITNAGMADAMAMLMEAGADPDYLDL